MTNEQRGERERERERERGRERTRKRKRDGEREREGERGEIVHVLFNYIFINRSWFGKNCLSHLIAGYNVPVTADMTDNRQYWKMMVKTGPQRCGDDL